MPLLYCVRQPLVFGLYVLAIVVPFLDASEVKVLPPSVETSTKP